MSEETSEISEKNQAPSKKKKKKKKKKKRDLKFLVCVLKIKEKTSRSFCCGSSVMNLTSIHEDMGSIPGLAQWVGDPAVP